MPSVPRTGSESTLTFSQRKLYFLFDAYCQKRTHICLLVTLLATPVHLLIHGDGLHKVMLIQVTSFSLCLHQTLQIKQKHVSSVVLNMALLVGRCKYSRNWDFHTQQSQEVTQIA